MSVPPSHLRPCQVPGLLADRRGRPYRTGQLLSVFGDTALVLAAGIWVKRLTLPTA